MTVRAALSAAALLAAGCSPPAPPSAPQPAAGPVTLSAQNPGANIEPIIAFFRRTCLENLKDEQAFQASLSASGWHAVRTQSRGRSAEGYAMPAVWRLDHGELVLMSEAPMENCILSLQGPVVPRFSTLRAALQRAVARPDLEMLADSPDELILVWPDRRGMRQVLTIGTIPASRDAAPRAASEGISLNLAIEPVPAPGADRE